MKRLILSLLITSFIFSGCLKIDDFPTGHTIYEPEYDGPDYIFLHESTTIDQPGMPGYKRNYVKFRLDQTPFNRGWPNGARLRLVTRILDDDLYSHGDYHLYLFHVPNGDEFIHERQYGVLKPGAQLYFELSILSGGTELRRYIFSYTI